MKRAVVIAAVMVVAAAAAVFLRAGSGGDEDGPPADSAQLTVVRGSVRLDAPGSATRSGHDRDLVRAGTILTTAKASLVELAYADGSTTRIGPAATYEVVELSRSAGSRTIVGRLEVGETFHKVKAFTQSGSRFEVRVSNAVAVVRGTDFAVRCVAPRPCGVAVVRGEVAVTPPTGPAAVVGPDRRVTIDEGGALSPVVEIAPDDPWINQNR